jgi:hypothetical protein
MNGKEAYNAGKNTNKHRTTRIKWGKKKETESDKLGFSLDYSNVKSEGTDWNTGRFLQRGIYAANAMHLRVMRLYL